MYVCVMLQIVKAAIGNSSTLVIGNEQNLRTVMFISAERDSIAPIIYVCMQ